MNLPADSNERAPLDAPGSAATAPSASGGASVAPDARSGTVVAPGAPGAPTPTIADGVEHELDPRYLMLEKRRGWVNAVIYSAVWFVVATVGGVVASATADRSGFSSDAARWLLPLWGAWAICYTIWAQVRPRLAYRHARYRVDARGIEIRGGIFVRQVISVPRSRVQHIDVAQGPFERRHGIATLSIYTAGVSHAMVSLPGLAHDHALRIRDFLLPHGDDGAW